MSFTRTFLVVILVLSSFVSSCEHESMQSPRGVRESARVDWNTLAGDSALNGVVVDQGTLHNEILRAFDRRMDFSASVPLEARSFLRALGESFNETASRYGFRALTDIEVEYIVALVLDFNRQAGVNIVRTEEGDEWKLVDHAERLGYFSEEDARAIRRLIAEFETGTSPEELSSSNGGGSETPAVSSFRNMLSASWSFWSSELRGQDKGMDGPVGDSASWDFGWGDFANAVTDAIYGAILMTLIAGSEGTVAPLILSLLVTATASVAAECQVNDFEEWLDDYDGSIGPGDFPPPCPPGQYLC